MFDSVLSQHLGYTKFSSVVLILQRENKSIKNVPEELGIMIIPNIHVVYYSQESTWQGMEMKLLAIAAKFSAVHIWRVSNFYLTASVS